MNLFIIEHGSPRRLAWHSRNLPRKSNITLRECPEHYTNCVYERAI